MKNMSENTIAINVTVNGQPYGLEVEAYETLLEMLRDRLDLTGTKKCCGEGECGACTVILDGQAVNSCIILAAEADGTKVLTIEGLAKEGKAGAAPAGLPGQGCCAVRILHSRYDHGCPLSAR